MLHKCYMNSPPASRSEEGDLAVKHARNLLLSCLGIDCRMSLENSLAGNFCKLRIYKALV